MPWNLALRNQQGRFQESIWKQIIWIDRERDRYIYIYIQNGLVWFPAWWFAAKGCFRYLGNAYLNKTIWTSTKWRNIDRNNKLDTMYQYTSIWWSLLEKHGKTLHEWSMAWFGTPGTTLDGPWGLCQWQCACCLHGWDKNKLVGNGRPVDLPRLPLTCTLSDYFLHILFIELHATLCKPQWLL